MAIEKIDFDKCTGCGMCEYYCPVDVIRFDKVSKKPIIAYIEECMLCGLCEDRCKFGAITVSPHKKEHPITSWR